MPERFTLRDWELLPEGFRAQRIDGRLLEEPAPTYRHQTLVGRLYSILSSLVGSDLVVLSPTDVVLDEHNVLQPDLVVVRCRPPLDPSNVGVPRLAFEVLSPSTERRDRFLEVRKLLGAGGEEIRLIDPVARTIEVRTTAGAALHHGDHVASSHALLGLRVPPRELFRDL